MATVANVSGVSIEIEIMTDAVAGSESYINNNINNIEVTVASSSNNQEKNFDLLDSVYSAAADGDIDKFQQHARVLDQILTPYVDEKVFNNENQNAEDMIDLLTIFPWTSRLDIILWLFGTSSRIIRNGRLFMSKDDDKEGKENRVDSSCCLQSSIYTACHSQDRDLPTNEFPRLTHSLCNAGHDRGISCRHMRGVTQ
ncbi:hypothetical protein Q3G72_008458 [Acer saccharum]|nr:hypothetical protein Q3G72_008458 [Acer saccharum]